MTDYRLSTFIGELTPPPSYAIPTTRYNLARFLYFCGSTFVTLQPTHTYRLQFPTVTVYFQSTISYRILRILLTAYRLGRPLLTVFRFLLVTFRTRLPYV